MISITCCLRGLSSLVVAGTTVFLHAQNPRAADPPSTSPNARATGIEVLVRFAEQPAHLARTSDGRILCTLYTIETGRTRLVQILKDKTIQPFPTADWSVTRQADGKGFDEIVGMKASANGWVAIVDRGSRAFPPRLVVWDLKSNKPLFIQDLSDQKANTSDRFVQDLVIDERHKCIYMAASNKARTAGTVAIYDAQRNAIRTFSILNAKLKDGSTSLEPVADGSSLDTTYTLKFAINCPITIDPAGEWVYMGSMGGNRIFRIPATLLASPDMTQENFVQNLQDYGTKELCAHMAADSKGNVYTAEDTQSSLGVFRPGQGYRKFAKDQILNYCLLYTSPSPRDRQKSRMPSSA